MAKAKTTRMTQPSKRNSSARRGSRRKNAGEGYGFSFHGAFKNKTDAVKKEAATKGAFIRPIMYKDGFRYVVMVPRTANPKRANVSSKSKSKRNGLGSWLKGQVAKADEAYSEWLVNKLRGKKRSKKVMGRGAPRAVKAASRQDRARGSAPPSNAVIADVTSALRNEGIKAGEAKRLAQAAYANTRSNDIVTVFRAAMARQNPKQKTKLERAFKKFPRCLSGNLDPLAHTTVFDLVNLALWQLDMLREGEETDIKTAAQRKAVEKFVTQYRGKENPAGNLSQQRKAAELYERFHGTPSNEVIKVLEAEGISKTEAVKLAALIPPEDYTGLGELVELRALTYGNDAKSAARISFDPDNAKERVRVCSNPEGTQLYFIGGNQDVAELARAGADIGFAMVDLGECIYLEYRTRKAMDKFQTANYYHELGEETGERPHLLYSTAHKRLYLVGGAYMVKPEGIVN
jgi:hypothetical protein